jgi:hypothetical protein
MVSLVVDLQVKVFPISVIEALGGGIKRTFGGIWDLRWAALRSTWQATAWGPN